MVRRVKVQNRRGQQWQNRQHGNNGDVLKQQDRKRALPGIGFHEVLFIEGLQNDRCRRKRQYQSNRQSDFPTQSQKKADKGNQRRGKTDL